MIEPDYYKNEDGSDLLDHLECLLTAEEMRGYYKGVLIKYLIRYPDKEGSINLDKASTYLNRFEKFSNLDPK